MLGSDVAIHKFTRFVALNTEICFNDNHQLSRMVKKNEWNFQKKSKKHIFVS